MLRNPNSISDKDSIIEDKNLEPFFITTSTHGGYTLFERVESEKGKEYIRTVCYPSTVKSAIQRVVTEKMNKKKKYSALDEYLNRFEEISSIITSKINI